MKAPQSFETSKTICPVTQHNILVSKHRTMKAC